MIPLPNKKYNIIYADPPWEYRDKALAGNRGACCKYETQPNEWLGSLPVANIVRQKIVELCGDMPRIELFARGSSKLENGWVKVGNEIDGCDIKASLDKVIRGTYLLDESLKTE